MKKCTKSVLELSDALLMINVAREMSDENAWKVAISIVDDGGHSIAQVRSDGCSPIAAYLAEAKARTAILGRRETRLYEEMVNGGHTALVSVASITTLAGGVPIWVDGYVIGAIGVSGVKGEQDSHVAKAAVEALTKMIP